MLKKFSQISSLSLPTQSSGPCGFLHLTEGLGLSEVLGGMCVVEPNVSMVSSGPAEQQWVLGGLMDVGAMGSEGQKEAVTPMELVMVVCRKIDFSQPAPGPQLPLRLPKTD